VQRQEQHPAWIAKRIPYSMGTGKTMRRRPDCALRVATGDADSVAPVASRWPGMPADRFVLGVASLTTAQYFSAYPSDPASRRAPCPPKHVERRLQVRLCLCPPFAPRAPGDVSVPFLSLRPARHYPRFWVRRSSSERRRDLNPPYLGAAQRTLWTVFSPSRGLSVPSSDWASGWVSFKVPLTVARLLRCSR
jgi:hypothetical protein